MSRVFALVAAAAACAAKTPIAVTVSSCVTMDLREDLSDGDAILVFFKGFHTRALMMPQLEAALAEKTFSPKAVAHLIDASVAGTAAYVHAVLPHILSDVVLTAVDTHTGAPLRGSIASSLQVAKGATAEEALEGVSPSLFKAFARRAASFWLDPLGLFTSLTNATVGSGSVALSQRWAGLLEWADAALDTNGTTARRPRAKSPLRSPGHLASLSPFVDTYVAIKLRAPLPGGAGGRIGIRCGVNRVALRYPLLGLAGLYLHSSAGELAQSVALYYSGGVLFGCLAAMLLLVAFLYRNRRSPAVVGATVAGAGAAAIAQVSSFASGVWSALGLGCGSGASSGNESILTSMLGLSPTAILTGYVLVTSSVVGLLLYLHGPIKNERAHNVIEWVLRGASALCVYHATAHPATSTVLALGLLLRPVAAPLFSWACGVAWLLVAYSPLGLFCYRVLGWTNLCSGRRRWAGSESLQILGPGGVPVAAMSPEHARAYYATSALDSPQAEAPDGGRWRSGSRSGPGHRTPTYQPAQPVAMLPPREYEDGYPGDHGLAAYAPRTSVGGSSVRYRAPSAQGESGVYPVRGGVYGTSGMALATARGPSQAPFASTMPAGRSSLGGMSGAPSGRGLHDMSQSLRGASHAYPSEQRLGGSARFDGGASGTLQGMHTAAHAHHSMPRGARTEPNHRKHASRLAHVEHALIDNRVAPQPSAPPAIDDGAWDEGGDHDIAMGYGEGGPDHEDEESHMQEDDVDEYGDRHVVGRAHVGEKRRRSAVGSRLGHEDEDSADEESLSSGIDARGHYEHDHDDWKEDEDDGPGAHVFEAHHHQEPTGTLKPSGGRSGSARKSVSVAAAPRSARSVHEPSPHRTGYTRYAPGDRPSVSASASRSAAVASASVNKARRRDVDCDAPQALARSAARY